MNYRDGELNQHCLNSEIVLILKLSILCVATVIAVTRRRAMLLNAVAALEPAVNGQATSLAGDSWISPDGKYLYQGHLGADKVVAYAIESDGSRKPGEQPVHTTSGVSLQVVAGV
ncbi:hypothetical protein ACPUER_31180 [Burkholderia sp. DN3021]|uniref:hypothetical protein n=1 Tax=Burkholderia sp. DN3021 TaxID=3410137 RepID=UPI003C7A69B0